jgi:hypothetical protein
MKERVDRRVEGKTLITVHVSTLDRKQVEGEKAHQ